MASGWGFGEWGLTPWGGGTPISFDCVPAGPQMSMLIRSPGPSEVNVAPDRIVKIAFYDTTFNLDPSTVYVTFNQVAALSGTNFLNGFNGTFGTFNNIFTVQILNPAGWNFDSSYVTFAKIKNLSGECLESQWTWFTQADPVCYTGLTPVPIEVSLQQPLQTFLAAEFLRNLLLKTVIKLRGIPIKQAEPKAARVIYQTACGSELSALLNQYVEREPSILQTVVCERENTVVVDRTLLQHKAIIIQAITALQNKGFITREYVNTFHDYLDSTNYNLRVSLVCNLVILSKIFEVNKVV